MNGVRNTPGPWMAGEGIDACHVYTDDGNYHVIATCDGSDFNEEVENANARLIAAAPELLEALKAARIEIAALITRPDLRAHPSDIPMDLNQADRECVAKAFNALTDAIAKAEGR